MFDELDAARRRLVDVLEALESLPANAPPGRRIELTAERDRLRAELRELATAGDIISADQLRRQIELARRRIGEHYANRLSTISGPSTGLGGGIDPTALHEMHRRMDATNDLPGLKRRLAELERRLAEFEASGNQEP